VPRGGFVRKPAARHSGAQRRRRARLARLHQRRSRAAPHGHGRRGVVRQAPPALHAWRAVMSEAKEASSARVETLMVAR
jgi:hypothetical protein